MTTSPERWASTAMSSALSSRRCRAVVGPGPRLRLAAGAQRPQHLRGRGAEIENLGLKRGHRTLLVHRTRPVTRQQPRRSGPALRKWVHSRRIESRSGDARRRALRAGCRARWSGERALGPARRARHGGDQWRARCGGRARCSARPGGMPRFDFPRSRECYPGLSVRTFCEEVVTRGERNTYRLVCTYRSLWPQPKVD